MLSVFSDERYMQEALKEAQQAFDENEVPVGAVVVCKNKIIARAYNQVEKLNDVTAHAEMLAITAATNTLGSRYLDQCTLYVTLEPCAMCGSATSWAQMGKIVYGASDPKRGFARFPELAHPRTEIVTGVLEKECSQIMKRFFERLR